MLFSMWLESKEISNAILGVVGGGGQLSQQEKDHLMSRGTKDFGPEIIRKLKNLGVVKRTSDAKGTYGFVVNSIDDGVKISDLIKIVAKSS